MICTRVTGSSDFINAINLNDDFGTELHGRVNCSKYCLTMFRLIVIVTALN